MSFLKPKQGQAPNNNLGTITDIYAPQARQGAMGTNFLTSLLTGTGDVGAAQNGYDTYLQNAGYDNALQRMSQSVVGGGAASGLLRSGATAKALQSRGAEINQGYYDNYLKNLAGLAGLGNESGQILSDVGKGEGYTQKSTGGMIASGVGKVLSLFSDRRLKEDVVRIAQMGDGLGVYSYRYLGGKKQFMGVMADEVERLRPWALGPVIHGYQTVDYGSL